MSWRERLAEQETKRTIRNSERHSVARHSTGETRRAVEVVVSRMSENGEKKEGARQV